MVRIIYIVFIVTVLLCCYSEEKSIGQRLNRSTGTRLMDIERDIQKILEILKEEDEKTDNLHTIAVMNEYIPECSAALSTNNMLVASKYWKDMITQIKIYDQSTATEIKVLGRLVTAFYNGKQDRLLLTVKFIKEKVEKGSALATNGYKALLDTMDSFGHLYMKEIPTEDFGHGLESYTYRTLMLIRDAESEASPIFNQTLPAVVKSILSGKEVSIRNNMTQDFMYAPANSTSGEDGSVRKILMGVGNLSDPRYIWKLKPVKYRWEQYNTESFYIENTFENKILAVADWDGSLKLADATEGQLKSSKSHFYISLIGGVTGEEVAIHCGFSYSGMQTLGLDTKGDRKMPKFLSPETLGGTETWLLQPKV